MTHEYDTVRNNFNNSHIINFIIRKYLEYKSLRDFICSENLFLMLLKELDRL